jgi:DivIVA domain-containing protein
MTLQAADFDNIRFATVDRGYSAAEVDKFVANVGISLAAAEAALAQAPAWMACLRDAGSVFGPSVARPLLRGFRPRGGIAEVGGGRSAPTDGVAGWVGWCRVHRDTSTVGRPRRWPWTAGRPRERTVASSAGVSIPSAVTVAPISAANMTTAAARARLAGSVSIPPISSRSSLMISGASCRMCRKDAKPEPASSTATRIPRRRSASRLARSGA